MLTEREMMGTGQDKAFVESMWGMKEHFWTDKLIKAKSCKKQDCNTCCLAGKHFRRVLMLKYENMCMLFLFIILQNCLVGAR